MRVNEHLKTHFNTQPQIVNYYLKQREIYHKSFIMCICNRKCNTTEICNRLSFSQRRNKFTLVNIGNGCACFNKCLAKGVFLRPMDEIQPPQPRPHHHRHPGAERTLPKGHFGGLAALLFQRAGKAFIYAIIPCGSAGGIVDVAFGHKDDHALSGAGEEDAIGVFQVGSVFGVSPTRT